MSFSMLFVDVMGSMWMLVGVCWVVSVGVCLSLAVSMAL